VCVCVYWCFRFWLDVVVIGVYVPVRSLSLAWASYPASYLFDVLLRCVFVFVGVSCCWLDVVVIGVYFIVRSLSLASASYLFAGLLRCVLVFAGSVCTLLYVRCPLLRLHTCLTFFTVCVCDCWCFLLFAGRRINRAIHKVGVLSRSHEGFSLPSI
jgi:hypothetical protein